VDGAGRPAVSRQSAGAAPGPASTRETPARQTTGVVSPDQAEMRVHPRRSV
jgi:hypothetical protein